MKYWETEMFGRTYRRIETAPDGVWVSRDGHVLTARTVDADFRGTPHGGTNYVSGELVDAAGNRSGLRITRTVASLVWESFTGVRMAKGRRFAHVDGNPLDDALANLKPMPGRRRMVAMVDPGTGESVDVFDSPRAAASSAGVPTAFVAACLSGKAGKAGGWIWRWDDDDPEPEALEPADPPPENTARDLDAETRVEPPPEAPETVGSMDDLERLAVSRGVGRVRKTRERLKRKRVAKELAGKPGESALDSLCGKFERGEMFNDVLEGTDEQKALRKIMADIEAGKA